MIVDWFEFVCARVNIGVWVSDSAFAPVVRSPELICGGVGNSC